jgi:hypothetical protein
VNGHPSSIPDGLIIELSRAKVLPGASAEADTWMKMLNDRLDECVATLGRERMAIEIERTIAPGWTEAEPQLLLLPGPARSGPPSCPGH